MKLYATEKGVIDQEVLGELYRTLLKHTDDVAIGYDEFGTFYEVTDEVWEKAFPPHEAETEPAPKKRGRPRKTDTELQE